MNKTNKLGFGAEQPGDAFGLDNRERPDAFGGAELTDALVFLPRPRAHNVRGSKIRSWWTGLFPSKINYVHVAGRQMVAFWPDDREPLQNHYSALHAKPW